MELRLRDGRVLTGSPAEITALLNMSDIDIGMGPYGNEEYYKSESKGLIRIREMNDVHIKNSLAKIYREWLARLQRVDVTVADFVNAVENGPQDKTFLAMFGELYRRVHGV